MWGPPLSQFQCLGIVRRFPRVTEPLLLAILLRVNHETSGEVQDLVFTPPVKSPSLWHDSVARDQRTL